MTKMRTHFDESAADAVADDRFKDFTTKGGFALNSFGAKGNIEVSANNADSGKSARNELSHLKSALFALSLSK